MEENFKGSQPKGNVFIGAEGGEEKSKNPRVCPCRKLLHILEGRKMLRMTEQEDGV